LALFYKTLLAFYDLSGGNAPNHIVRCARPTLPHFLDIIKLAHFAAKDMNDNIACINNHPVTLAKPFDFYILNARSF
jgi:hypothetical protein